MISWTDEARRTLERIDRLIEDALRDDREGIGAPEPLRHDPSGLWSRRIDGEHRLVYRSDEGHVVVSACRVSGRASQGPGAFLRPWPSNWDAAGSR
ncbi:MAG: Txe/YoeB family addiction module toxin [Synergistaceae bacterium]|nr:Txe/YoeB family addiction module toxin [Synergistaceae bacterium]